MLSAMPSHYNILLCHYAGVTVLYLNGQEAMRTAGGRVVLREFRYPSMVHTMTVRQVPHPWPRTVPTLAGFVEQAVDLLGRVSAPPADHSRLIMLGADGSIRSYLNGLPVELSLAALPLPGNCGPRFLDLARQADLADSV